MLRKLEGDVTSGRCGHCFTHIFDSCAFLYGGVCVPHRTSCAGSSLFTNATNNSSVYMFDYESLIGQNYLSQVLIHKHITPLH